MSNTSRAARRRSRSPLLRFIGCGVALGFVTLETAPAAAEGVSYTEMRAAGTFSAPDGRTGRLSFGPQGGLVLELEGNGEQLSVPLQLNQARTALWAPFRLSGRDLSGVVNVSSTGERDIDIRLELSVSSAAKPGARKDLDALFPPASYSCSIPVATEARTMAGAWATNRGTLTLAPSCSGLAGTARIANPRGYEPRLANVAFVLVAGGETVAGQGYWEDPVTARGHGMIDVRFDADGRKFDGQADFAAGAAPFTGMRPGEEQPAPGPQPQPDDEWVPPEGDPNAPPVEPQPQPQPQPEPQPEPASSFKALGKYEVRVDRVVAARDAPRTDVFVTLRNATNAPLYATSGALMVRLEDSEGVGKVNGQILRPTIEGRAHFASTPVIEPGGELRAKYSFHPDPGATARSVTITEGDRRATFGA